MIEILSADLVIHPPAVDKLDKSVISSQKLVLREVACTYLNQKSDLDMTSPLSFHLAVYFLELNL